MCESKPLVHAVKTFQVFRHERDVVGIVHDVVEGPESSMPDHGATCSFRVLPVVEVPLDVPVTCIRCAIWDGDWENNS